jgi:hypothetical protein
MGINFPRLTKVAGGSAGPSIKIEAESGSRLEADSMAKGRQAACFQQASAMSLTFERQVIGSTRTRQTTCHPERQGGIPFKIVWAIDVEGDPSLRSG